MVFDIYTLIFDLLQVQPTGDLQADFLNLIFFPHVVIIIWLYILARGPLFGKWHKGIGMLVSLSAYIFIIYYGWYSMIASLAMFWMTITIIGSLFYFMLPKIIHPGATGARMQMGRNIAKLQDRSKDKRKNEDLLDTLQEEVKIVKNELRNMKASYTNREERAHLRAKQMELEAQIREIKRNL